MRSIKTLAILSSLVLLTACGIVDKTKEETPIGFKNRVDNLVISFDKHSDWKVSSEQNLGGIKCLVVIPNEVESISDINNIDSDTVKGILILLYSSSDMVKSEALIKDKIQIDSKKYTLEPNEPAYETISDESGKLTYYKTIYSMESKEEPKQTLKHSIISGKSSTGTFVIEGVSSDSTKQSQIEEMINSLKESTGEKNGLGDKNFVNSLDTTSSNEATAEAIDNIHFFKDSNIEYFQYELRNEDTVYTVSAPYFNNLLVSDNENQFIVTNDTLTFSVQCELISKNEEEYLTDIITQLEDSEVHPEIKVHNKDFENTLWKYNEIEYTLNNRGYNYYVFTKQYGEYLVVYRIDIYKDGLSSTDKQIIRYLVNTNIT